jgi:Rrf2 family protein
MFLSKECDYAIRVMRSLSDKEMRSVRTICDMEVIPQAFAYKIIKKLEKAGLVVSYRGANGGYKLIADPDEVTLLDVVNAVDRDIFINECLQKGYECPRNTDGNHCGVHLELDRIQGLITEELKGKTLASII